MLSITLLALILCIIMDWAIPRETYCQKPNPTRVGQFKLKSENVLPSPSRQLPDNKCLAGTDYTQLEHKIKLNISVVTC